MHFDSTRTIATKYIKSLPHSENFPIKFILKMQLVIKLVLFPEGHVLPFCRNLLVMHQVSHIDINIHIIINIQGWAIWPVPSSELKLISPSFLWSPNCSLSVWAVKVWF
jgi:hypothetical protein